MRDGKWYGRVKVEEIGDDALKSCQRGRAFQIADVLAHKHLRVDAQRHGVLEMRADA